jgi:hypothetical protein
LLGGLSTTSSSISALEKSIFEDAFLVENMKKPLLFANDGPTFPDPNDSVFVALATDDSNTFKQDSSNCFGPRTQSASYVTIKS